MQIRKQDDGQEEDMRIRKQDEGHDQIIGIPVAILAQEEGQSGERLGLTIFALDKISILYNPKAIH